MFFHEPIPSRLSHGVGFGIRRTGPNTGSTHTSPTGCLSLFTATELIAGRGIEGDRYFKGIGTYSPKPDVREVTLIEMEVLDALARGDPPFPGDKVELAPGDHRRNLTTLGVPLNHLVGKRFKVCEAVLKGER